MSRVAKIWAHKAVIGFVILALATAGVVGLVVEKDNATRCSVVALIAQLSENSARSARATIVSNTATPAQKAAARKNVQLIRELNRTTRDALGHPTGKRCAAADDIPLPPPTRPAPVAHLKPAVRAPSTTVKATATTTAPKLVETR